MRWVVLRMAKNVIDATLRFVDKFTSPFQTAVQKAEQNTRKLNSIGKTFQKTGKSITETGKSISTSVTLPIVALGTAAVKTASDFEASMSKVKAITQASTSDFKKLNNEAIKLGAETAFSSTEVADAMTEMAKAGWETEEILSGMSGVLDAAASSGEQLATVSTIVADAITGFGLKAGDSSRVADLLTQAANAGTIDIADLGETFKYVAPVAQSMNLSIEDVTTAISAMSMAGIKGSQAGTSLRTLLTNLVKPSDDMAVAMKKLGISATNSDGSMKSLDGIVENLRNSFSGLTQAEKAKYAATLAGKTGMSGMLALLNLTEKQYNDIGKSMDECKNVASKTAKVMQDNLKSKIEQLGGSLESLGIKIGNMIIPKLTKITEKVTDVVNNFTNMDSGTQKSIMTMLAFAAAVGPILMIVGKLTSGVGGIIIFISQFAKMAKMIKAGTTAMTIFSTCTSVASLGIVAAIVAVIAIVVLLIKNWDKVKAVGAKVASYITKTFSKMGIDTKKVSKTFGSIGNEIMKVVNVVKQHMPQIQKVLSIVVKFIAGMFLFQIKWTVGMVIGVVSSLIQNFTNIVSGIKKIFTGIIKFFTGVFTGNWKKAFSGLADIVKGAFEAMVGFVKTPINTIIGLVNGVISGINNISIDIPDGIPGIGGKHIGFNLPSIPMLYKGTNNWGGGLAEINEPRMGGEIVNLPSGSQVIPHDKSLGIAYNQGKTESKGTTKNVTYNINIERVDANDDSDVERVCKRIMELLSGCEPEPA